jgi:FdhE protein
MAYVALEPVTHASRLAAAAERWTGVIAGRPELEPAVRLQQRILRIVVDLADAVEHGRLPRLSLPAKYVAAKLQRGIPALAREPIPIPAALLGPAILSFCDALADGGAGQAAEHIRSVLEQNQMDRGSLLAASLSRDQEAIRTGAVHRGLAPDLLWLVAELAVSPFVHAVQRALFTHADPLLAEALAGWCHGCCPACGSWPALAEAVAGHRVLRCSFCAAAWELQEYACIYCGERGEPFQTAAPDPQRKDRRLELCATCGAYLKTVEAADLSPFPLVAIADLETIDLDMAAMENRFHRPPLKQFNTP